MAFELGERVTSSFTGPGTIMGPLERDEDRVAMQLVKFDNAMFGTRLRPVGKMESLGPEDEPKAKPIKIKKTAAQLDLDAATLEGLTFFTTNKNIKRDEPNISSATYVWLAMELSTRPTLITIYATKKNYVKIVAELMGLTGWDVNTATAHVTIRERNGGSKWNLDFANFKELTVEVRDAVNVNFGHYDPEDPSLSSIRRIRIGSKKLVQDFIRGGFSTSIQKAGGDVTQA
jgi:hypothetical protein